MYDKAYDKGAGVNGGAARGILAGGPLFPEDQATFGRLLKIAPEGSMRSGIRRERACWYLKPK